MTLPAERTLAVLQMRAWLMRLAYEPGRINKRAFRRELAARLRHYPTRYDMTRPSVAFEEFK